MALSYFIKKFKRKTMKPANTLIDDFMLVTFSLCQRETDYRLSIALDLSPSVKAISHLK
jgi:hypothetical protein